MSDSTRIKELRREIEKLCGNCDRPDKEELGKIILSSMTLGFNEGLKVSSADRPQGEWIYIDEPIIGNPYGCYKCSECNLAEPFESDFCPHCGARMKGADDE